jgi:hypothetical protein
MADNIYAADGTPRGFRLSNYIYDLAGNPVGRVFVAPSSPPPKVPPQSAGDRRSLGQNYPDCFDELLATAPELS